jgi:hypothetical protein
MVVRIWRRWAMLVDENSVENMTVAATVLVWPVPMPEAAWPESFDRDGKTWQMDHMTVAANGEVQWAEYTASGKWLIVYNE